MNVYLVDSHPAVFAVTRVLALFILLASSPPTLLQRPAVPTYAFIGWYCIFL
jgi:hypothetical protein